MGTWSTLAPTLPDGASWSSSVTPAYVATTSYYFRPVCSIARGSGTTVYVRVQMQAYLRAAAYTAWPNDLWAEAAVGGGATESSQTYDCSVSSASQVGVWVTKQTLYYTGTAAAGTAVKVRLAYSDSYKTDYAELTAPALLARPIYVNVGGTVKQVTGVYLNVGGAVKECEVYTNISGTVYRLL